MSVLESPDGDNLGKVGLKRKLTGPPRLLLGKSKSKGNREERETRGPKHSSDSNGTQRGPKSPDCPNELQENKQPEAASADLLRPETGSTEEMCTIQDGVHRHNASFGSTTKKEELNAGHVKKRWGWKRCFIPSLLCLKGSREKLEKMSTEREKQCNDHVTQKGAVQTVASNIRTNSSVKGTGRFLAWGALKRLFCTSNYQSKSNEGHPVQNQHFVPVDTKESHSSFKDKLGSVLRHRTKKPSPFFQERLVGTHEYIEEESIVLSNKCADGVCLVDQERNSTERDMKFGGSCSETLTICADVTVVTPMVEEIQDISELSTDHDHPKDLASVEGLKQDEDGPQKCAEEGLDSSRGAPSESSPVQELSETQEEMPMLMSDVATKVSPDVGTELQEHPLQTEELHSPMAGKFTDTPAGSEQGEAHGNEIAEIMPASTMENEVDRQDCSPLKSEWNHVTITFETSDADKSPLENHQAKDDGCQLYPNTDGLDPQCNEKLLQQTACALVKAAMTAALTQLKEELNDGAASVHREAQELQGQA